MRKQSVLILVLVFALFGGGARAQDADTDTRGFPPVVAAWSEGFASDAEMRRLVGSPQFSMSGCSTDEAAYHNHDDRVVRATLTRVPTDFEQRHNLIDALLRATAHHAWRACPHRFKFLGRWQDDFHYNLERAELAGPNGELLVSARLGGKPLTMNGDQALSSSRRGYDWLDYRNYIAERRDQAAIQQQQQNQMAARARDTAYRQYQEEAALKTFWGWVRGLGFAALALWAWRKREKLLYWFYSLTPHPAAAMVDRAVLASEELDGEAFAASVRAAEGENDVEKTVRADQARTLAERWRKSEAAHKAEEDRVLAEVRRETEKNNALFKAQKELLDAAIAHEKAAARVDALRKKKGKT